MEIIDYIALCILAWGALGAICLLFIGIRKDIQSYFERRKEHMRSFEFTGPDENELKDWHWPYQRRSGEHYEYACPHGVGHSVKGIHGCDGCCGHPSFKKEMRNIKRLFRKGG